MKLINKNIKVVGDYVNQFTKVKLRCLRDGNEWEVKPTCIMSKRKTGCPMCKGGVSNISEHLRGIIRGWKKEVMKNIIINVP